MNIEVHSSVLNLHGCCRVVGVVVAEVLLGGLAVPAVVGRVPVPLPVRLLPPPLSRGDGGRDYEGEHQAATSG